MRKPRATVRMRPKGKRFCSMSARKPPTRTPISPEIEESRTEADAGFFEAEVFVADDEVSAPGEEGDARESNHDAADDERGESGDSEEAAEGNDFAAGAARWFGEAENGE